MILVTGGTGFLGAYIIRNLVEKGKKVRAIRRSPKLPFFISKEIFDEVEWVEGDLLDMVSLKDAMAGVDAIIHAAAIVSFAKENRRQMYQVNVEGTANLVDIAIDQNIKRLLHISSVAALGRTTSAEVITEAKKWKENKNNTHYAISKHQAEMHVWRGFAEGLDGLIINPGTILGFGDWHESSCAIFKNSFNEFTWYTNGVNAFVGVEDVAEVAVQLLMSGHSEKRFIVSAENRSFQDLLNSLADHFHKKRPHREATRMLGAIAWRMEKIKSMVTGKKALLTKETARIAHSKTSFDHSNLLRALPGYQFTPLETVLKNSCEKYLDAVETGLLTL